MPGGGDIQLQPGLYTYALIGPDVWPSESESQLGDLEKELARLAEHHDSANETASGQTSGVFGEYWTDGDGAAAAEEHYAAERAAHQQLAEACRYIGGGYGRLGGYVRSIKRKMREAHDEAHRKIEEALRANKGLPVTVDVTPILTEYLGLINGYCRRATNLRRRRNRHVGRELKLAPPGQQGEGGGFGTDQARTTLRGPPEKTGKSPALPMGSARPWNRWVGGRETQR